jgi:hypothetical protein
MEISLKSVYDTAACDDVDGLRTCLLKTLSEDINTASRMLEAIPKAWNQMNNASIKSGLCGLYLEVCSTSSAPEIRALALTNLGSLMDGILSHGDVA